MGFKERDLRWDESETYEDEIAAAKPKKSIEVRINAGIYANRKIYVASANMRPTLARTKSIIFDVLMNWLEEGFTILDAFAGTGAIGLEALSRGASKAVFVDINNKNIRSIEKNLQNMDKLTGRAVAINKSILRPILGSPVDVVFLDPPYDKSGLIPDVIGKLEKNGWINEKTILVLETHKTFSLTLPQYQLLKEKKISSSLLRFLTKSN